MNLGIAHYSQERGQATIGALMWLGVAGLCIVGVLRVGAATQDSAMARTAADAAALAGAADGSAAAIEAARRNEAEIIELRRDGWFVTVVVRVGNATAEARAERVVRRGGLEVSPPCL